MPSWLRFPRVGMIRVSQLVPYGRFSCHGFTKIDHEPSGHCNCRESIRIGLRQDKRFPTVHSPARKCPELVHGVHVKKGNRCTVDAEQFLYLIRVCKLTKDTAALRSIFDRLSGVDGLLLDDEKPKRKPQSKQKMTWQDRQRTF